MVYSFLGEDVEVPYIETSARTGENIDEVWFYIFFVKHFIKKEI